MDRSQFFYCYNKRLFIFLKEIKGFECLTVGRHPVTNKIFSMFWKNDDLQNAIDDYKVLTKK